MKSIIFYAPLGTNTPHNKIGGAEAGCLKTKEIYETAGINVVVIEKPAMSQGLCHYILRMMLVPVILFIKAKKAGAKTPVHIVGFYTRVAGFERLLMNIAHFCGNKVIYELRNGSMIQTYKEGTRKYKDTIKDLILKSEVVLCQGKEYVDFIRNEWGVERSYYPNYIMDNFIMPNNLNRSHPLRLIYFGRVTKSKNIDIIIKTLAVVRNTGFDAFLDIIGGYDDKYKTQLDAVTDKMDVKSYVTFYGRKDFSFIAERLKISHYFIFPSQEKQEGHSNSLTEAMGCGVVPIVSPAGFNVSICGDDNLVVYEMDAEHYAKKIIEIENAGKWKEYSSKAYERVGKHYTQSVVSKNLIYEINKLF